MNYWNKHYLAYKPIKSSSSISFCSFPIKFHFLMQGVQTIINFFRWQLNSYAFRLYFFLEWFQKLRKWWTLCGIQTPAWLHHIVAVKRKTILFSHTSELNNCGRPGYLFHSRLFTFHLGIHPAWLKFFLLSEILLFPFRQDQNTAFYLERKDKELVNGLIGSLSQ